MGTEYSSYLFVAIMAIALSGLLLLPLLAVIEEFMFNKLFPKIGSELCRWMRDTEWDGNELDPYDIGSAYNNSCKREKIIMRLFIFFLSAMLLFGGSLLVLNAPAFLGG